MPAIVTRIQRAKRLISETDQVDEMKQAAHQIERHRVRQILGQAWEDPYTAEEELARTFKPRLTGRDII